MRRTCDWVFRSRADGRIVIAQRPNLSLSIFIVGSLVRTVVDSGTHAASVARVVASLALLWWAVDEILRGVNPWRRFLGTTVLAFQIAAVLR